MSKARIADYVVRVSRVGDRGENLKSPAEQRARVEQAAAREGVTLRHGHEELDTSGGAALDKRPGLLAAVEAVERGEITAIYVAYFDRLARSTKVEDEVIERVEKAGGDIFAVDLGQVTHGSATTKLTTKFMGAISEYVRNQAKERFDIAKQNAVAHGIWPSPKVPLGLIKVDKRLAHDPEYGPVVVRAYQMRDEGATIQDVREFLKVKGIKRDYSAVSRMLCNPIYVGRFEYGSMVNGDMVAPLIDEAVFRRVQKRRDKRGRRAKSERLLARLDVLRCKSCGSRMAVHTRTGTRSGDYPTYRCGKPMDCKDRPAISARIVEDFVERFTRLLASELVGEASNDQEVVQAERELETAQSAFDAAVEAFDGLDAQSVKKKLQELQEGVEATQHQLDQLTVNECTLRQINTLRDWDDMTLNQKRGLIKAFYAEITVAPTREAKGIDRIRYKLRMHAELPESRRTKRRDAPRSTGRGAASPRSRRLKREKPPRGAALPAHVLPMMVADRATINFATALVRRHPLGNRLVRVPLGKQPLDEPPVLTHAHPAPRLRILVELAPSE